MSLKIWKQPFTIFTLVMALGVCSLPEKLLASQKTIDAVNSEDFADLFAQPSDAYTEPTYFSESLVPISSGAIPIRVESHFINNDLADLFIQSTDADEQIDYFPDYLIPIQSIAENVRLEIRLSRRIVSVYQGKKLLKSYPIAVGKPGWETPTGNFQVMTKIEKPTWINPFTNKSIKGGDPENPLGKFWIGFWTDGKDVIGFHGTPTPSSVGRAASHGCVRMYNKDVEELFKQVSVGTPVTVLP